MEMHRLKMVTHACREGGKVGGRRGKGGGKGKEEKREEREGRKCKKEYTSTRHTYACMYNYANNNMQISHHLGLFPGGEGEENSIFPSSHATRTLNQFKHVSHNCGSGNKT